MSKAKKPEVLEIKKLSHHFRQGEQTIRVLNGVSLTLQAGAQTALMGPSGSGKSTLLHLMGLLEQPKAGDILIHGKSTGRLNDEQRTLLRRQDLGFVFQFHHLLPEFTAVENVAFPLLIGGQHSKSEMDERAADLLARMGLGQRLSHRPSQLSGGEQQRVAVARALIHQPAVVLADEPTGNLDQETAKKVMDLMIELSEEKKVALFIATHDPAIASRLPQVYHLTQGHLE